MLYHDALWLEERRGDVSTGNEYSLPQAYTKIVECYVDDIAVKSHAKGDHITDLKRVFNIMQVHQLKMNSTKSFLRIASGKFLGFIVTSKGIHLDSKKVRAIQEMQPPRNPIELRGLQG